MLYHLGTGMLTRQLTSVIKNHSQIVVEYTVTDVSYSLVQDLATSLELDRLIPKVYDVTKDPYSQGYSSESYDIIVAYHVLHVAPELKTLTLRLHDLLVPGGFLLAVEVDNTSWSDKPGAAWMDFTLGSFAEWFSYLDGRDHCSMSPSQWEALLQSSDFYNFSMIIGSKYCLDFIFTCQKKLEFVRTTIEPIPAIAIYQYKDGEELQLQRFCRTFNPSEHGVMCIWTSGTYDGDSAMGLVMTLAKEFTTWTIWLAMFDFDVDVARVEEVIKTNHLHLAREHHVYFSAEGIPSFPRVVRLPPTSDEHAVQSFSPSSKNHLVVQVSDHDHGSFIGEVVKSKDPEIPEGSVVAGLNFKVRRKALLTAHSGSIVKVDQLDRQLLPYLPAILLQFECLGSFRFMQPLYDHPPLQILIVLRSKNLTKALSGLLDASSCRTTVLTETTNSFVDVVVTDPETLKAHPLLEQNVGTNGRMVIWSPQLVERVVSREPWMLHHIFRIGLSNFKIPLETPCIAGSGDIVDTLPPNELRDSPLSLLDPYRVYLLIGGIGGIGLHLAVWLYQVCSSVICPAELYSSLFLQNGARHIYLTSRRGRDTVLQADDALLRYKLQYLESLMDLDLRLIACDALSVNETKEFFSSIKFPIAGCFLMPLILCDSLFLNQTEETMNIVKRSKVEAFNIVSSHSDIKAMDFFVAFSSVAALWGNPGQSNYGRYVSLLSFFRVYGSHDLGLQCMRYSGWENVGISKRFRFTRACCYGRRIYSTSGDT